MGARGILFLCSAALLVSMTTAARCTELETFNTGLTTTVPDSEKRRSKIVEAFQSCPSDFVCLQEIWTEEDLEYVIKKLSPVFPHHYSAIHQAKDVLRPSYTPGYIPFKDKPCSIVETTIIGGGIAFCGLWNDCLSKSGWALGECITKRCAYVFKTGSVTSSCVSCIFMNALTSITEAMKLCSVPGKHHNRLNGPGLLVMGKQDLTGVAYRKFHPGHRMTIERGYIQAQINDINLACTHLSSNVPGYIEYDMDFDNYKDQQTYEINVLDSTFSGINTVLLGDLNTGPRVTSSSSNPEKHLDGEFPDNYRLLENQGFRSPYVSDPGLCTYCSHNPLTHDYPNQILDHVMVRPSSMVTKGANRVYNTTTPPISDHYGVRLQVCT